MCFMTSFKGNLKQIYLKNIYNITLKIWKLGETSKAMIIVKTYTGFAGNWKRIARDIFTNTIRSRKIGQNK